MDPLEELDTEAEEDGFSSRSEHLRYLLLNRPDSPDGYGRRLICDNR